MKTVLGPGSNISMASEKNRISNKKRWEENNLEWWLVIIPINNTFSLMNDNKEGEGRDPFDY